MAGTNVHGLQTLASIACIWTPYAMVLFYKMF